LGRVCEGAVDFDVNLAVACWITSFDVEYHEANKLGPFLSIANAWRIPADTLGWCLEGHRAGGTCLKYADRRSLYCGQGPAFSLTRSCYCTRYEKTAERVILIGQVARLNLTLTRSEELTAGFKLTLRLSDIPNRLRGCHSSIWLQPVISRYEQSLWLTKALCINKLSNTRQPTTR
jgi:hypothetical protein